MPGGVDDVAKVKAEFLAKAADVYRYMNFDQIPAFVEVAETVVM